MLNFEFCLHTGDSPPVYCRQLVYGTYEKKIMNTHIKVLEDNDWMCDYIGPWGSLLLLAANPIKRSVNILKHSFGAYVSDIALSTVSLEASNFPFPIAPIV